MFFNLYLASTRDKRIKPIKLNFSCSRAREDVLRGSHKNDFYNILEQLFDISAKDFEKMLKHDEPMSRYTSAAQEG